MDDGRYQGSRLIDEIRKLPMAAEGRVPGTPLDAARESTSFAPASNLMGPKPAFAPQMLLQGAAWMFRSAVSGTLSAIS